MVTLEASSATPLALLREWITRQAGSQTAWFDAQFASLSGAGNERALHLFFGLAPRRLGKADLELGSADLCRAHEARDGWNPRGWSIDGAARVAALLAHQGERPFPEVFHDLVRTADARELVALYRGLGLYPNPGSLDVGEGLRSNMRAVFESIAHANPYPRDHLDTHRFNHMVLKALFVDSRLYPIVGLDDRRNPELARILLDYADERWAAGRTVSPELWRCVAPFADSLDAYPALARALSGTFAERSAATLALISADTPTAQRLLTSAPEMRELAAAGRIGWNTLFCHEAA